MKYFVNSLLLNIALVVFVVVFALYVAIVGIQLLEIAVKQ